MISSKGAGKTNNQGGNHNNGEVKQIIDGSELFSNFEFIKQFLN